MMHETDVLIVGAGPVGMLTALTLAQGGASVRVLEKEPHIINSPRAAVYFPSTLIILQELGILDELLEIGFTNRTFGTHIPEFDYHSVVETEPVEGIPYDYQLHAGQHDVARVAMEHARKLGVEVLFGHEVTGFAEDEGGITVSASGQDFRAKWLIGADGARSTVRKLAGIEFEGHTWPERFVATNVKFPFQELGYQQANFVCDPVNMAVIAQLDREGVWRCTYMEDSALPVEGCEERIHQRYEWFMQGREDYEIVSFSPYMLHQRAGETLRKGRVLLAGDAAHATNPCGGLGLTSGVWTGVVLADVLGAVLRGEESEEILDRFSDERRRVFWDVVSPAATENKRMLQESDPEQRRQDMQHLRALNDNPESGALLMLFAYKVIGDVLRPDSRWADADPSAHVAIDIGNRQGQIY
ncbi:FAD-dependent oxidoreductase [Aurantiacibacter rhizosphaerae]|uniref:FAD-binding protein n=1 Tax=Aurantiacibacter rhizosphaerae TaxID=2691582 RepID=A0A844XDE5_9SPHN|nr:FAD-dependent monooxygenase [Aurantiacibacter rhizosphaerae]MWV27628.1 FAD-binding protein [Aurantiacibacter rhizosphaerae]